MNAVLRCRSPFVATIALVAVLAVVVGCGSSGATPAASGSPAPSQHLTVAQLKLDLINRLGPLWFCDPDEFPISRGDDRLNAQKRFGEVQADSEAYAAITARLGIPANAQPTIDEKVVIYQVWKQLSAIKLDPASTTSYRFDYLAMPAQGAQAGTRSVGTIDASGAIAIEKQAAAGPPPCPICLARGTRIATPNGAIAIENIRAGMAVWSRDAEGNRVAATVTLVGSTPVPGTHRVVRLVLADGRIVRASPGHPLADGRTLGSIRVGDVVDRSRVVSADLEAYGGGATFDLLPSGPTGVYWADGVPLGSTLSGR